MMRNDRRNRFSLLLALLLLPWLALAEPLVLSDIRVEGLQRISPGTVFNYLPVKIGDKVEGDNSGAIIRALYETGFFDDVRLERQGTVLLITVKERPAIGEIKVSGNEAIATDKLMEALKQADLAEGRVFNRAVLDKIEQELRRQYFNEGRYGVDLKSTVTPLERNRVAVAIDIVEGDVARIKRINLIGNQAFKEDQLLDQMQLNSSGTLSFITHNDRYSRQKLAADLESLKSFYLDRGYINFKVDSTQVSISPDKQSIFVTITLTEGAVYTLSDVRLAGDMVVPTEELIPLIKLNRGEVFSRKEVMGAS